MSSPSKISCTHYSILLMLLHKTEEIEVQRSISIYFELIMALSSKCNQYSSNVQLHEREEVPLMPKEVAPAFTAFKAYSICTNFPEGLQERIIA